MPKKFNRLTTKFKYRAITSVVFLNIRRHYSTVPVQYQFSYMACFGAGAASCVVIGFATAAMIDVPRVFVN